jgi:hypothetical protein
VPWRKRVQPFRVPLSVEPCKSICRPYWDAEPAQAKNVALIRFTGGSTGPVLLAQGITGLAALSHSQSYLSCKLTAWFWASVSNNATNMDRKIWDEILIKFR